jgi:methyltransferase-like protein
MSRLTKLAINDEGFIFDPSHGDSYVVNDTGLFILNALKGKADDQDIVKGICRKFEVSVEEAEADLADFKDSLEKLGLKTG